MEIIVESFLNPGEPSDAPRRMRPLPGQGFAADCRVECSRAMREAFPPGQLFRIDVQLKSREGGPFFLYSYHGNPWQPVSSVEAQKFIAATFGKTKRN